MNAWQPDSLLDGYEQLVLPLPGAELAPGEPEDVELTATLVRRGAPSGRRAFLYVHGWSDYFFQAHFADVIDGMGFDFYALDLRRYGRNMRDGLLPGYIDDVADYGQELDAAMAVLRQDHQRVTVMGHSTGGLVTSLWADGAPEGLEALVLNSPWLAQGGPAVLQAGLPVVHRLGGQKSRTRPLRIKDNGLYTRSIDPAEHGVWSIDAELKGSEGFQVRLGWLAAIFAGHRRVAKGLDIRVPILTLTSGRSDFRKEWDEALLAADTVLDVDAITTAAARLGRHVTIVRIDGGLHDLALSRPEPRQAYFDELQRWVQAYLG